MLWHSLFLWLRHTGGSNGRRARQVQPGGGPHTTGNRNRKFQWQRNTLYIRQIYRQELLPAEREYGARIRHPVRSGLPQKYDEGQISLRSSLKRQRTSAS